MGTVCHRYSAIHVLFSVVLCSGFAGMHLKYLYIFFGLPHQDLLTNIATPHQKCICYYSGIYVYTILHYKTIEKHDISQIVPFINIHNFKKAV